MRNWLFKLLWLLAFCALVMINESMPFLPGDDFLYQLKFPADSYLGNQKIWNLSDYFESCYNHYLNYNYRILPHALLQLILLFPSQLFSLINSIVFLCLPVVILKVYPRLKVKNPVLTYFLILLFIWIFHIDIGWAYLWKTGSVNYSWFLLAQIYLFSSFIKKSNSTYAFSYKEVVASALICTSNENAVLSLFVVGVFVLYKEVRNRQDTDRNMITALILLVFGGCLMMFSPSMELRLSAEGRESILNIDHILEYIKRTGYYIIRLVPIALLPLMFIRIKLKQNKSKSIYVLCIAVSFLSMFIAPLFEARSALFPFIICLMMVINMIKDHEGINKGIFLALLIVGSFVYLNRYSQLNTLAIQSKENLLVLERSKGIQDTVNLKSFCVSSAGGLLICDDIFDDINNFHNKTLAAVYGVSAVRLEEGFSRTQLIERSKKEFESGNFKNRYQKIGNKLRIPDNGFLIETYKKTISKEFKSIYVFKTDKELSEDTIIIIRGSGNSIYYRLLGLLPVSLRLNFLDILESDREGFQLDSKRYFVNEVYLPNSYRYFVVSLYSKSKHSAIGKPWIINNHH